MICMVLIIPHNKLKEADKSKFVTNVPMTIVLLPLSIVSFSDANFAFASLSLESWAGNAFWMYQGD